MAYKSQFLPPKACPQCNQTYWPGRDGTLQDRCGKCLKAVSAGASEWLKLLGNEDRRGYRSRRRY